MSEVSPEAQLPPEEEQGSWKFPRYLDEFEHVMGPAFTDPVLQELLKNGEMQLLPDEELEYRRPIYTAFLRVLATERRSRRIATKPRNRHEYSRTDAETRAINERFDDALTKKELDLIRSKPRFQEEIGNNLAWLKEINDETPEYSYVTEDPAEEDPDKAFFDALLQESFAHTGDDGDEAEENCDDDVQEEVQRQPIKAYEPSDELFLEPQIATTAEVPEVLAGTLEVAAEFQKGVSLNADEQHQKEQRTIAVPASVRAEIRADHDGIVEGLFEHQVPYITDIVEFLREPPQLIRIEQEDGTVKKYRVHGATVDAATGSGKTVLMAKAAIAANIMEEGMLIVTPERTLARQLAGLIGDDTFRRFGPPGMKVDVVDSQNPKLDHTAHVAITTIEQFVMHMRGGMFKGKRFGLLAIDEVHTLTEPQFQQAFLEQWHTPGHRSRPLPAIGFSATPYYSEEKDARALLPRVIKHGDMLTYMDRGILSAGQFFTFLARPEYALLEEVEEGRAVPKEEYDGLRRETLLHSTIELSLPLLREGRRGIVFCEAGDESGDALELARRIRGLGFRAKAMHSHGNPKLAQKVIAEYHAGELDMITSVGIGIQGLNADFNFVGLCGNVQSLVKIKQITGRGVGSGARLSDDFPTTTFFHVVAGYANRSTKTLTFADAFGVEQLEQGALVGQKSDPSGRTSRIRADESGVKQLEDFPEAIRIGLQAIHMYTLQEFSLALNDRTPIPEDYVPFAQIYAKVKRDDLTPKSVFDRLDRAGYAWRGQLETDNEGNRFLARYYEPAAKTFFTKKPIPPRAGDGMKNKLQTAKHLGVSEAYLTATLMPKMADETTHKGEPRLSERGRTFTYFPPDAIAWMEGEVAKIQVTEDTDKTMKDTCIALGIDETAFIRHQKKAEIKPTYKRRADGKGFIWAFSEDQQEVIAGLANKFPLATDEDWSLPRIAEEAGVPQPAVHKHLTDEEKAQLKRLRSRIKSGQQRELDHLREPLARAVVQRLKDHGDPMPAHLFPYRLVTKVVKAPAKDVPKHIKPYSELVQLPLKRPARAIRWKDFKILSIAYDHTNLYPQTEIDFSRMPTADDVQAVQAIAHDRELTDEEKTATRKIVYARAIQLSFMTAKEMGHPDGIID